jgi:protein O-GlcNAc transferase
MASFGLADATALFSLGCRLLDAGRAGEALRHLNLAAQALPDDPAILEKLAIACQLNNQLLSSLKAYDRLIEMGAATAATWCGTGEVLARIGEYAQALAACENSLKLDNSSPATHNHLARVSYHLGDIERAILHLEYAATRSTAIAPWISLATAIPGSPGADLRRILEVRTQAADKLRQHLGLTDAAALRRTRPRPHALSRIGYLSAFFHAANYMKPVWGLINHHDRSSFEIHLFSDSPEGRHWEGYRQDPKDRRHDTSALSNDELAALVEASQIDILVDLNAFSCPDRLALFLSRPAPVTVAWFNMYATSGLPGLDYLIGDDDVLRPGEEKFYSERVHRLPVSCLTFQVDHPTPPVVPPPCLENGYLTFGSLVSQYKITPLVLDAWATILKRADGARLFLANTALKSIHNRQYLADRFAERGVDADRLILCGPADHLTYLRYYDRIDVALDAFPYNGGTTTMEAIWQGVPVLTCNGDRWAARTSQSLLRRTHLQTFIAAGVQGVIDLAVKMARSPDTAMRLASLRRHMRSALKVSSACDSAALARAMEEFYRGVLE